MKYTLCITQRCNLSCSYCYITKKRSRMSLEHAKKIIEFAYALTPANEAIEIGFFGGEPLLEFELVKGITRIIEGHASFNRNRVVMSLVTNGTIFSKEIGGFMSEHNIAFCLSCDGPAFVHDVFRVYKNGQGSSKDIEITIAQAKEYFPFILVNAVYHPKTFRSMPQVVEYFSSLGINQIYFSPDYRATWTEAEAELLQEVFDQVGDQYINYYRKHQPHFISFIDSKIAAILRGGYRPEERCRMGKGEFGFGPSGNIYPCERLIGSDDGKEHCIGKIQEGFSDNFDSSNVIYNENLTEECKFCSLSSFCMNWCGCSNYFSSGHYNKVSPFICASEKAAIKTAFRVFQTIEGTIGPVFTEHLSGVPPISFYRGSRK